MASSTNACKDFTTAFEDSTTANSDYQTLSIVLHSVALAQKNLLNSITGTLNSTTDLLTYCPDYYQSHLSFVDFQRELLQSLEEGSQRDLSNLVFNQIYCWYYSVELLLGLN